MGTGLAASAAHPRPNNIWVPPPPPRDLREHVSVNNLKEKRNKNDLNGNRGTAVSQIALWLNKKGHVHDPLLNGLQVRYWVHHWVCLHGLESRSERRFKTWFGLFLIWKPDFSPCKQKAVSNQAFGTRFETRKKGRFGSWSA